VEVLLATYNGERFLGEQIDSILNQDYANVRVLVRDDGSTDGTVAILEHYAALFPDRFRIVPASEATGGPKWNFLRLMQASTADYACFADQDDIWLPQKVTLTMQAMKRLEAQWGNHLPLLAFTDLCVVNQQLEIQHASFWKLHHLNPQQANHFARLLGQNVVTGCTMMLNRPLLKLALRLPDEAHMHDGWVALLAAAFGRSEPVLTQTVLYRQHDRNVFGAGERVSQLKLPKFRGHQERQKLWQLSERQAKGMLRVHGAELPKNKRTTLEAFVRCGQSGNRLVRIGQVLRHGFYVPWMRYNLAMLWYLWDIEAAKAMSQNDGSQR
jgi:glycosyltransferase involved in cell wall biosynthesis